ncbi:MAG: single-stranded-DNA-specific exonuclease RecJ [Oscillospiraceae bacterium]|nr:single-stranded-DNA-specific exonuclease RecJ [Oscillospiraceae bacterium]
MRFQNWDVRGFDRDAAVNLCREGFNPLISVLLVSRGVTDGEEVRSLISEGAGSLYDPFLLADMGKAVARINAAIAASERIAVFGDYDVDGMTSCAMLSIWLRSKKADYEVYIPSRLDEGYGLSKSALDKLKANGVNLVVTVDCGITAVEEAAHARALGMSLVITDHHECKTELPDADAVVDPKRPDCAYPNKVLAGVGVAFKLICALEPGIPTGELIDKYADLVALGTIADVMPVAGENRELIRYGLKLINEEPRLGLRYLLAETIAERRRVTSATVGFALAPRLNAAGRMGRTELALELLLTGDDSEAAQLAEMLGEMNDRRREMELSIFEEAASMLPEAAPDGPIVLAKRGWYQGVTGIVAAKMAERYGVPAIIISIDDDGVGRGSCRSAGSFRIYEALRSCEDLLDNYGGHDMASGVTIADGQIEEFRKRITGIYKESSGDSPARGLRLDFEVEKPELLAIENIAALESLEPFGAGHAPPCICIRDALLTSVQSIGSGKHSRLRIEKSGKFLDCIFFSMPAEDLGVGEGMRVDVAFEPQINVFRGRSSVQLHVFDMRPALPD